jgi:hypothetical protein
MNLLPLLFLLQAPERAFRVYNGSSLPQLSYATAGLPLAQGEVNPGGSLNVRGVGPFPFDVGMLPFETLERWGDGSVRRARVEVPVVLPAYTEATFTYRPTSRRLEGGIDPWPFPASSIFRVAIGEEVVRFDSGWTTIANNHTRWDGRCEKRLAGLNLRLYASIWEGQPFGRATLIVGNDDLVRTEATAKPIPSLDLHGEDLFIAPFFRHAHGIVPLVPFRTYRLLGTTSIGDGARWGTAFSFARTDVSGEDLVHAVAAAEYPLFGMAEPQAEDSTSAYGLFGRLKGEVYPVNGPPHLSRSWWESWSSWWLENAENSPWGRNGFWTKQEGTTGGHPDWGPAPCGRDDRALSPRGLHRWWCLSLTRLRTPDHFSGLRWNQPPVLPTTGAFNGWVNSPLREPSDYNEHLAGSNGWSGSDDAHREENVRHRVFQWTGEWWIQDELLLQGNLACLRAKPNGGFGEGRDVARALQRKLIAWLIASPADRAILEANLVPWSSYINAAYPSLPGSNPPLFGFSILMPGDGKHSPGTLSNAGLPPNSPYILFPWSESHVSGTFAVAAGLTSLPGFKSAGYKSANLLARIKTTNGALADIVIPDGRLAYPRVGTWPCPGLIRLRSIDPRIEEAALAHIAAFGLSSNWDERQYVDG